MKALHVGVLNFNGCINSDGEIRVTMNNGYKLEWISKNQAEEIVIHLARVFEIDVTNLRQVIYEQKTN